MNTITPWGIFPAIFIIPTTGIYAALVESSRNLNLSFYFYKINFNSILPSIFGLNLPKSPLQVFKENFVCISQLPRKITEVQPSLVIAVLIKFLKTHTHLTVKCLLFLSTASDVLTLCRSTAFYSRIQVYKWTYTHVGGWRKSRWNYETVIDIYYLWILHRPQFYSLNITSNMKKPVGFQTKAV